MIDRPLVGRDEDQEDLPEPSRCALLDRYWDDLRSRSEPEARRRPTEPDLADWTIAGDLHVLSLLHRFGHSADAGEPATPPGNAATESKAGPEPPRRIGKYLVIERLDSGGQAQVFRVLHPELAQELVLKLSRRPVEADTSEPAGPAGRPGLLREGRLLAQCHHPNLVPVVDLDVHEGRPFVVMEHVPGLTLEQFADQRRPGPRQAARLVAELARVVTYLHARGIVHQDIKPRNVLVDGQGRPRLIDFGMARWQHAWTDDAGDWIGGTACYMSPEQALGRADQVGPWTDVFGLGGLLYSLLTGRPLYQGASRVSVFRQAMKAECVPIRQVKRRVPRALERICQRALAADPERRYRMAVELERALRRFLARRRMAAGGLIAAVLLAVAWFAPRSRSQPQPADAGSAGELASAATVSGERPAIPSDAPAPELLRVDALEIQHVRFRGDSADAFGPIGLSPQPILEDDRVQVRARLNRPAYGYLIALNPDGKDQLCVPSQRSDRPTRSARIQLEESTYFALTDGPGLQAFVVVASSRPLPPYENWKGVTGLRRRWKPVAVDAAEGIWRYQNGTFTRTSGISRGPLEKRPGGRPAPLEAVCEYLENVPELETIEVLAFPVRPQD